MGFDSAYDKKYCKCGNKMFVDRHSLLTPRTECAICTLKRVVKSEHDIVGIIYFITLNDEDMVYSLLSKYMEVFSIKEGLDSVKKKGIVKLLLEESDYTYELRQDIKMYIDFTTIYQFIRDLLGL